MTIGLGVIPDPETAAVQAFALCAQAVSYRCWSTSAARHR
jgi:hypothetical protein